MRIHTLSAAVLLLLPALLLAGCASTPADTERREQRDRDIEAILSQPADNSEYAETKRCLRDSEYRSFKVLDDRHILFEGSRDRYWINRLSIRCPDLRHAHVLQVNSSASMGRICRLDTFQAADWFDWPWYRRSPWRWTSTWHSGVSCSLGDFQAVTPAQVEALKNALRR